MLMYLMIASLRHKETRRERRTGVVRDDACITEGKGRKICGSGCVRNSCWLCSELVLALTSCKRRLKAAWHIGNGRM